MSEFGLFTISAFAAAGAAAVYSATRQQRAGGSRRAEHARRVARRTEEFLMRYREILEDMRAQGLDRYVPEQFRRAEEMADEVEWLLDSGQPFAARELNMELGQLVGPLPRAARRLRRERRERQVAAGRRHVREAGQRVRKQRLQATAGLSYRPVPQGAPQVAEEIRLQIADAMAALADPIERDFAVEQLRELMDQVDQIVALSSPEDAVATVRQRIEQIRQDAAARAAQWHTELAEEERRATMELVEAALAEGEEQLREEQREDQAARAALDALRRLREALAQGTTTQQEAARELKNAVRTLSGMAGGDTAEPAFNEEHRKQIVRSVIQALNQVGFAVQPPMHRTEQGRDLVIIQARKPAGQVSWLAVDREGRVHYKLDGYEGMECRKDVDAVMKLLQEVYGLPVTERRVFWQNPDRIKKGAEPLSHARGITR